MKKLKCHIKKNRRKKPLAADYIEIPEYFYNGDSFFIGERTAEQQVRDMLKITAK